MDVLVARVAETSGHGFGDPRCGGDIAAVQGSGPTPAEPDVLDVSLRDCDLALEVELLGKLMVAANESDHLLAEREVDRILGLAGLRLAPLPVVPPQR